MCGAIALALPGPAAGPGVSLRYFVGRLLYNLGRVTTYVLLGAGAGLVGQSLRLAGTQQTLSIASGVLILLLVVVPERYTSKAADMVGCSGPLAWVKSTLASLFRRPSATALYTTGVLNGLLPCGLVYVALAGALSASSVLGAAAYMACFGLGTLPLLLGLALTGKLVPLTWRRRLRGAVPYVAAALAVLFVVRGLGLGIPYLSPHLTPALAEAPASQPGPMHSCH